MQAGGSQGVRVYTDALRTASGHGAGLSGKPRTSLDLDVGIVCDIYFRQDRPGVAIFLECASTDEALKILADLPLAKAGLIEFDAIPLGPFANWELLFVPAGH
jgi:hypothetical protein